MGVPTSGWSQFNSTDPSSPKSVIWTTTSNVAAKAGPPPTAVISVAHPHWDERPLLIAVKEAGAALEKAELLDWYDGKIARWWKPDDVVFVDELPHTATGKLLKTKLRDDFKDYTLPTA